MTRHDDAPPRLAEWMAGRLLPPADREFALGDLAEDYKQQRAVRGARRARFWYWRQALLLRLRAAPSPLEPAPEPRPTPGATVTELIRETRFAIRQLFARPLITITAVVTLALGVGATVAMVSVAWPMLLAPLPFPDEDRLTKISLTYERNNTQVKNPISRGDYVDLRTASSFESMAAFNRFVQDMNLTDRGDAEQVRVGFVSAGWFSVLAVQPVVGGFLRASDFAEGVPAIVLSERLWRHRFGGDRAIVGQRLRLDGRPYEVAGVAPASAGLGTIEVDAWLHQPIDPADRQRGAYFFGAVARLRPGVTIDVANQELAAIMARAATEFPEFNRTLSARAELFRDETTADNRSSLQLLLVSAGLVLVVSVINLAGLQLARHLERGRERAVRYALGATRWRLARQVLVENLALACVGGLCGLAAATATVRALEAIAPSFGWLNLAPTSRPLMTAFAAAITLCAGLIAAAVPAWRAARNDAGAALQTRVSTGGRLDSRWRATIVAAQVGATAVLLVVAALVARSQWAVLSVNPGFDFRNGLAADLSVPRAKYDNVRAVAGFFDRVIERIEAVPGVERACAISDVPLDRAPANMTFVAEGTTKLVSSLPSAITPGCVSLLRLQLLRGRWFTNTEAQSSVVISASMAKALWPDGRDPVGQRVHFGVPTAYLLTVVGVTGDIRVGSLESAYGQQVWLPQSVGSFPLKRLLVRAAGAGTVSAGALQAAVRAVEPEVALARVRTMDDIVNRATAPRRFALFLLAGFALIAVVLSAVGIYSVLAHVVGRRTQEIGIRLALGARAGQVVALVIGQVSVAVAVGILAGLWSARALSGMVSSLLFGVGPTEPRFYVGAGAFVIFMASMAAWAPIRRAIRIDPKVAMRDL